MNYTDFTIRMAAALMFGGLIGLERQWRQRMTGLRTNALVAVGSAIFVMMGSLIPGVDSQGRLASYVISGIGFLGGGVILRDGLNVRGLNTAATLWCTAAVGSLAGCGLLTLSAIGTLGVLATNLVLRPLAQKINRFAPELQEQEILYRLRCTCRASDEAHIRALLLQSVARTASVLVALHSKDHEAGDRVDVKADLKVMGRKDEYLEQIVTRLSLEPSVTAISWEVIAAVDEEDASLVHQELAIAKNE
jgi:putative Mg2+ transporter-C (MgtC) family protein